MNDLKIHAVTYNVATSFPSERTEIGRLLGLDDVQDDSGLPDIYFIGCQEVKSQPQNYVYDTLFDDPWAALFKRTLSRRGYVRVRSCRLQGVVLQLLVRRQLLLRVRDLEEKYVRLGFGGVWGNKGAVCLRFSVDGVSVCLVNCHLAAHDHMLEERCDNYAAVLEQANFHDAVTRKVLYHDYVVWLGDLNFRVSGRPQLDDDAARQLAADHQLTPLLERDQLREVMANGRAFAELHEPTLTFKPTYKLVPGRREQYDTSRRPAWTDRVLYRVNAEVYDGVELAMDPLDYQSHPEYTISDHRPVTAQFNCRVFADRPVATVEFLPVSLWLVGCDCVAKYRRDAALQVSGWDWIGLFRADFASLDEYVTYIWAPRTPSSPHSDHYVAVFPEDSVTSPGSYALVYFGRNGRGVYGVSEPFDVAWSHRRHSAAAAAAADTGVDAAAQEPLLGDTD